MHSFEDTVSRMYRRVFSIAEIEQSVALQWVFGATLFTYFITYYSWIGSKMITTEAFIANAHSCWPWFTSCGEWMFLEALPEGYSQSTLYMIFFGMMLAIVYYMWRGEWVRAHALLLILFLWKFVVTFFLTFAVHGNFDYYHIIFSIILLFFPYKLFFLQTSFVLLYFLAATIKIHEGWILGTYFTSLKTGLPIFPDAIAPLITNIVIFMQIVGAWFLFSSRPLWQRAALIYFIAFHLYSGIVVLYRYPSTVLPMLLILFGPMYQKQNIPFDRKSIAGWVFLVLLCVFQSISLIIPGDAKMTLEGNDYGLYMFEANHQCVSNTITYNIDGTAISSSTRESSIARNRCNPYNTWFTIKEFCNRNPDISRVSWTFEHSINGGPFYRIVDAENACSLSYRALGRNYWIMTPEEGAPVTGRPVENLYY